MSNYPVKFGKYLLLERINVGGMAEVFKAKTFGVAGFERILAIKRILPNLVEDDEFIKMFIDEARIAVQLNHTNIVQIYELGKHGDHYYIAMEYLGSRDLRAILDRMRANGQLMQIPQAAYVCAKVCEGLDYAHKKRDQSGQPMNIIHRDVSPQNILIGFEGEVKVIDFGIAKAANRASKTQAGVLKGKFGYMSPEQVRGLPIDRRSDIFAVGVLLYEMLTGERLFIGESDFSTLERVRNAEVIPPTNFNKKITQELERIVLKALAREVEDRYQHASDLAEDLAPFLIEDKQLFNMKRLASSMKEMYAAEIAQERQKQEEFLRVNPEDAKPEKGDKGAQSSILPLHIPPHTDPAASANTVHRPDEEDVSIDDDAAGFGEDKTFVIEASPAGMILQNQPTEAPQEPVASGKGKAAVSGKQAQAPRPPQQRIQDVSGSGSATGKKPPSRPENTNDDYLDQVSLYGDESGADEDDSRTLVSAPNPFFDNPDAQKTGEQDDDDEIDASEMESAMGAGVSSDPGRSAARTRMVAEHLSDAPTVMAANDGSLPPRPSAPTALGTAEGMAPGSNTVLRSDEPDERSATKTALPQRAAANQGFDPVAAAMEEEERMAMEAVRGSSGGRNGKGAVIDHTERVTSSPGRASASLSGDVAGQQLPMNIGLDDQTDRGPHAPLNGGTPAAVHVPPHVVRNLMIAAGASLVLFLVVTVIGIVRVSSGGSGKLTLYPVGDSAVPADLVVLLDDKPVANTLPATIVIPKGAHKLSVRATGLAPVDRVVRGTGKAVRQPVLIAGGGKAVEAKAPDTPDKTEKPEKPDDVKSAKSPDDGQPAAVVGGAWRLSLAAVADDSGKPLLGADVHVNGTLRGKTPFEGEIDGSLNRVEIQVKKAGYVRQSVMVDRNGRDRVGPATVRLGVAAGEDGEEKPDEEKGAEKGAEKGSEKGAEKGSEKASEKIAARSSEKGEKGEKNERVAAVEKPAEKAPTEKPVEKGSAPAEKTAQPAEKSGAAAKPKAATSTLQIGTQPFADTIIDGRKLGSTPFYGPRALTLTVGKHRVEFVDNASKKKYKYEINIVAADPANKVIIMLGKPEEPRVLGQVKVRKLD